MHTRVLKHIANLATYTDTVEGYMAWQISSFGPDASAGTCHLFEYVLSFLFLSNHEFPLLAVVC